MKILICAAVLFLNCSLVFATTCATFQNLSDIEYAKKLREVDSIFEGKIVSITDLGSQSYLIKLKMLRIWKGDKTKEITINYGNPCSSKIGLLVGEKQMIYGYKQENSAFLFAGCCRPFDDAKMKITYGEGEAVEQSEDIPETPQQEANAEDFRAWLWKKIGSFFTASL